MNDTGFHSALLVLTGSTVAVGALWDVLRYRIPNAVTFGAMGAGLLYHAGLGPDAQGLLFGLEGLIPLLAIGFALFARGLLGAGDAKLLGAVGALLGPKLGLTAFIYAALCGGVWALIWVLPGSYKELAVLGLRAVEGRRLPYGPAIAAGTGLSLVLPLW